MKIKLGLIAFLGFLMSGCSEECPAVYIPVYEISVYDMATGSLICSEGLETWPDLEECDISYQYTEQGDSADITVSLDGYETKTVYSVDNQTWLPGCWDNPENITSVDVYLTPN